MSALMRPLDRRRSFSVSGSLPHAEIKFGRVTALLGRAAVWGIALLMLAFIILPLLAILVRAASGGIGSIAELGNQNVVKAVGLSLITTPISMICVILLGLPLAYIIVHYQFPFKRAFNLLIEMPVMMPPVVAGLGLLMAFGRRGLFGPFLEASGVSVPFSTAAVVVAQVFVSAPFFIRAAQSGFQSIPHEMEEAASIDGADKGRIFWSIWLPLSWSHLMKGLVLSWARALGEFGATVLFAGNLSGRIQTMPLLVYSSLENDIYSALWVGLILIGVSLLLLGGVQFASHQSRSVHV